MRHGWRQDQGARASFRLLTCCCAALVALANVPLLLCPRQLAAAVSNEPAVRSALASVVRPLRVKRPWPREPASG